MAYLVPRGLLSHALPDLPPAELSQRFVGAVIDPQGREVPITEEMVHGALQTLSHPLRAATNQSRAG